MNQYIFYILSILLSVAVQAQIKHVEPPFWWSDMHIKELQIMIHGDNIADYTPEIEGVVIKNIKKTENPNYLFITIETQSVPTGSFNIKLKKRRKMA